MGVKDLWKLLEHSSAPVQIESLRGKKLAVDASIWIYQFIFAKRDESGHQIDGAHIEGFLLRICKLLFHGIKPVFVFDGKPPNFKRKTIEARQQQRKKAEQVASKVTKELYRAHMQMVALGQASKISLPKQNSPKDDYELDKAPQIRQGDFRYVTQAELDEFISSQKNKIDFNQINIDSAQFSTLPPELQHEIILNLKNHAREPNQARVEAMVNNSITAKDFSEAQIRNVIHRATLTERYNDTLKGKNVRKRVVGMRNLQYILSNSDSVGFSLNIQKDSAKKVVESLEGLQGFANSSQPYANSANHEKNTSISKYIYDSDDSNDAQRTVSDQEWIENWIVFCPKGMDEAFPNFKSVFCEDIFKLDKDKLTETLKLGRKRHGKSNIEENTNYHAYFISFIEAVMERKGYEATFTESAHYNILDSIEKPIDDQLEIQEDFSNTLQEKSKPNLSDFIVFESESESNFDDEMLSVNSIPNPSLVSAKSEDVNVSEFIQSIKDKKQVVFSEESSSEEDMEWDSVEPTHQKPDAIPNSNIIPENLFNSAIFPKEKERIDQLSIAKEMLPQPTTFDITQSKPLTKIQNEVVAAGLDDDIKNESRIQECSSDIHSIKIVDIDIPIIEPDRDNEIEDKYGQKNNMINLSNELRAEITETLALHNAAFDVQVDALSGDPKTNAVDKVSTIEYEMIVSNLENSNHEQPEVQNILASEVQEQNAAKIKDLFLADIPFENGTLEALEEFSESDFEEYFEQIRNSKLPLEEQINQARQQIESITSEWQKRNKATFYTLNSAEIQEIQELLLAFGLPFLTAPTEAESQCAQLIESKLVDGIITNDSDVFLFGGDHVYRNLFEKEKYVEYYNMQNMKASLQLDREKLIQMAHLLGSDYTPGIIGIGPVQTMEIIKCWPGEGLNGLAQFAKWAENLQIGITNPEDSEIQTRLRTTCKKVVLPKDSFTDDRFFNAFLYPKVDEYTDPFKWELPSLDLIRHLVRKSLNWPDEKIDNLILPALKNKKDGKRQMTLDEFISVAPRTIKSARIRSVLGFEMVSKKRKAAPEKKPKSSKPNKKTSKKKKPTLGGSEDE